MMVLWMVRVVCFWVEVTEICELFEEGSEYRSKEGETTE